jgi:flagellar biosynthesis GTPase FlhF
VRYPPNWLSLLEARELPIASGISAREAETDITRALREGTIRSERAFEQVTFRGHTVDPELFRRMTVEDRNRFRLRVPADLAAEDLDWDSSRPRRPWPLGEGYFAPIAWLELSRGDLEKVFSLVEAEASNEKREEASQAGAERKRAEANRKRRLAEAKRKRKDAEEQAARKAREEASQADAERKRAEAKRKRKRAQAKRNRKRAEERAAREEASHASDTGRAQPRRYWARKAIDGAYPNGAPGKDEVPNKAFVAAVLDFVKTKGWNAGGYDTILCEAGRRK